MLSSSGSKTRPSTGSTCKRGKKLAETPCPATRSLDALSSPNFLGKTMSAAKTSPHGAANFGEFLIERIGITEFANEVALRGGTHQMKDLLGILDRQRLP